MDQFDGRKTREPGEKPAEQGKKQQQNQPTLDIEYENGTHIMEVEGQRSRTQCQSFHTIQGHT